MHSRSVYRKLESLRLFSKPFAHDLEEYADVKRILVTIGCAQQIGLSYIHLEISWIFRSTRK